MIVFARMQASFGADQLQLQDFIVSAWSSLAPDKKQGGGQRQKLTTADELRTTLVNIVNDNNIKICSTTGTKVAVAWKW